MRILLNNCTLLSKEKVNIFIEDNLIKKISKEPIDLKVDVVYNLDKKLVMPGLCDINFSKLSYQDSDTIEWETKTALKSGFTTIIEMPKFTEKNHFDLSDILRRKIYMFNKYSFVNFLFPIETELDFKLQSYRWYDVASIAKIDLSSFEISSESKILDFLNKINEVSRYYESIIISVKDKNINTFFKYFKNKNVKIGFIDISSIDEINRINKFKENGFKFYSIVYMDSLFFSEEMLTNDIKKTKMSMRTNFPSNDNLKELNIALKNNLIDILVPNHSILKLIDKFEFKKPGNPGLETFVPLLIDLALYIGIDLDVIDSILFRKMREFLGLKKQLIIQEGAIASLTVVDIDKFWFVTEADITSISKWTQYEGRRLWGVPILTICNGNIGYDSSSENVFPSKAIKCRLIYQNE